MFMSNIINHSKISYRFLTKRDFCKFFANSDTRPVLSFIFGSIGVLGNIFGSLNVYELISGFPKSSFKFLSLSFMKRVKDGAINGVMPSNSFIDRFRNFLTSNHFECQLHLKQINFYYLEVVHNQVLIR
jgi:hypothetical protein